MTVTEEKAVKNEIIDSLDYITNQDMLIILSIIKRFKIDEDDILTKEDILDIEEGEKEFALGEGIPHNKIKWYD